jgi:hypothetical protein
MNHAVDAVKYLGLEAVVRGVAGDNNFWAEEG